MISKRIRKRLFGNNLTNKHEIFSWKNSFSDINDRLITFFKYGTIGDSIHICASSICQLECPLCPQQTGEIDTIGRGNLKFKDFKKFIDTYPKFKNIELSNSGEIFFNPELKDIIRYAYAKKVNLTAYSGVNLNDINQEMLECLVKYQFKAISVSIDGASGQTYKIYRKKGNFDKVIDNIKKMNHFKKIYNSNFPLLSWQFIIFGHNERELPIARKMAQELNMQFKPRLNDWDPAYSPIKNEEFVAKELGFASGQELRERINRVNYCFGLHYFYTLQINWDGKLLGCCDNCWGDFGNVFESGLKSCLKSEKYKYAKKMILGQKKARDDIPCFYCPDYKKGQTLPPNIKKMQTPKVPLELLESIVLFKWIFFKLRNILARSIKYKNN